MSNTYTGKVLAITNKSLVSSKSGKPFKIWYADVDGVGQVNLGFKNNLKVGDMFSGVCESKYNELKLVALLSDGPPGGVVTAKPSSIGASNPTPPPTRSNRGVFPIPKDSGEFSIIRQSALKAAIETISLLNNSELTNEEIIDKVIDLAYIYTDFSSGHRELKQVETMLEGEKTGE